MQYQLNSEGKKYLEAYQNISNLSEMLSGFDYGDFPLTEPGYFADFFEWLLIEGFWDEKDPFTLEELEKIFNEEDYEALGQTWEEFYEASIKDFIEPIAERNDTDLLIPVIE